MRTNRPFGWLAILIASLSTLAIPASALADPVAAPPDPAVTRPARTLQAAMTLLDDSRSAMGAETASRDEKSLANGLYMSGTWSANWSGGTVNISLDRINNDSYTRTSGTLRLELWAVVSPPSRGAAFTGYRLAVSSTLAPLATRTDYVNIRRTSSFATPPDGAYWLNLVLTEYSSSCAQSDGYCQQDSLISTAQATFGTPQPSTVTVYSAVGQQCYQNVPYAVFQLLQQSQPGLFTSYPSSTTCASLGAPFFAGYLADTNGAIPVYTTNAEVALVLCQAGYVVSCTVSAAPSADYSDMWWNPSESGWGLSITQHASGIAFVAWYTYDAYGNPKWYVATNCRVIGNGCSGTLYETVGPPFGPAFDPSRVSIQAVGSVTFTFSSASTGTMRYTLNGASGTKSISRQPY